MDCEFCGNKIIQYGLFPRSYRLYIYFCKRCLRAFLAHHFDLNLEIYRIQDLDVKKNGELFFFSGLKVEPRVFDFKVDRSIDAVIVAYKNDVLGELAKTDGYIYAPYSRKALNTLCRYLKEKCDIGIVTKKVAELWERAE